jgi:hypothetical protein
LAGVNDHSIVGNDSNAAKAVSYVAAIRRTLQNVGGAMIVIQDDVWRAECVAGFGLAEDGDQLIIQLFPLNTTDSLDYVYDNDAVRKAEYKKVIKQWQREIEGDV